MSVSFYFTKLFWQIYTHLFTNIYRLKSAKLFDLVICIPREAIRLCAALVCFY